MNIQIATVANSFQSLSVTGLTIYDVDNIPAAVDTREKAALVPLPDYITDFTMERETFGTGATAQIDITYTLNYRLFFKEAGAGRAPSLEYYDGIIDMIAAIWTVAITNDTLTGTVDFRPANRVSIGVVLDAANNQFLGCDLSFTVVEYVNN